MHVLSINAIGQISFLKVDTNWNRVQIIRENKKKLASWSMASKRMRDWPGIYDDDIL